MGKTEFVIQFMFLHPDSDGLLLPDYDRFIASDKDRQYVPTEFTSFSVSRLSSAQACSMIDTIAEPTTTPSDIWAISAACSAVLIPNPVTAGRLLSSRIRVKAALIVSFAALFVPVIPAMAT